MFYKLLAELKKNEGFLGTFNGAMSALHRSGVFDVLRSKGRTRIVNDGASLEVMATQAARSAGYQEALDDLFYFRELYLDPPAEVIKSAMDYGGTELAVKQGYLTEEEANAIRTGTAVTYPDPKHPAKSKPAAKSTQT